jgi:hypothetical protein
MEFNCIDKGHNQVTDEQVHYKAWFSKKFDTEIRYWENRSGVTPGESIDQAYKLWIFAMEQKEKGNTLIAVPADQAVHYRALVDFDNRLRERGHTEQVQP